MALHLSTPLQKADPEVQSLIDKELTRQKEGLELIASENYASLAVIQAQGSVLTNKYAEGYPSKRYYGGCEVVDQVESLCIERAKKLFSAHFANVQPHSGSQANMASYFSLLAPGDKILGMSLSEGGHLTHGSPVNFSGRLFQVSSYGLNPKTETIDFNIIEDLVKKEKPRLIVAGASAYPRSIDFAQFSQIAKKYGCLLLVDMAHIAGLVAAGLHPNPVPFADIVTSTTHKTLRGPRGGLILTQDSQLATKINSQIFPGIQGGPLEHVIAAKAVCFGEALKPEFKQYQKQVIENAKAMAETFLGLDIALVSGGTDNHLLLVKTLPFGLTGKEAEILLEQAGVCCNKNMVPQDTKSPFVTSGIRLGTPAITTRGLSRQDVQSLSLSMGQLIKDSKNQSKFNELKSLVENLCRKYPLYKD